MRGILMQQDNTIPQQNQSHTPYSSAPQQQPGEPKSPRKKKRLIREFLANFGILIAAPVIALLLIVFVFQSYEVDGPSMKNTLQDGDRLVVVKLGKTFADIKGQDYIPDRYSIIIFHKIGSVNSEGGDRQLVKRVIGLPGERVKVNNGEVTVYNDAHPTGFNPDKNTDYEENIDAQTPGNIDLTVKEDEVFVLGDNRNNSSDSRAFGTVPAEQIVGELALRIYPFSSFDTF